MPEAFRALSRVRRFPGLPDSRRSKAGKDRPDRLELHLWSEKNAPAAYSGGVNTNGNNMPRMALDVNSPLRRPVPGRARRPLVRHSVDHGSPRRKFTAARRGARPKKVGDRFRVGIESPTAGLGLNDGGPMIQRADPCRAILFYSKNVNHSSAQEKFSFPEPARGGTPHVGF